MTSEEIKSVEEIKGTAGFRVIEYAVKKKIQELDTVKDLDIHGPDIGLQAMARQTAVKWLEEFLKEINLESVSSKETRKTYE